MILSALLVVALLMSGGAAAAERPPFDPGRAGFEVRVRDERCPYRVLGVFVMPGERIPIEIVGPPDSRDYSVGADAGVVTGKRERRWEWVAPPEPGVCTIVVRSGSGEEMVFNVFVMVPMTAVVDGALNGYRIGAYPSTPLRQLPIYRPPRGFIEVTEQNRDTPISPHFTLGQFECKQNGGYPRYVVLRERLLLKLELVLEAANRAGYRCDTFAVLSGYRTPEYNAAIKNVKYSRHVWGGAADIYIDEDPVDENMDDLNGDGRIDIDDAGVLYDIIDELYGRPFFQSFLGGLGRYRETDHHGPFVHVDVRGFRARWGD